MCIKPIVWHGLASRENKRINMLVQLPGLGPIEGKAGFAAIGAICGAIFGAFEGLQVAIVFTIAIGLIGLIGGAFYDGDYENSVYPYAPGKARAWAAVGYFVLFGLAVAIFGILLSCFVPDWRPLLIAAGGMLLVVIALSYGEMALL
jgi:hypothetical protein